MARKVKGIGKFRGGKWRASVRVEGKLYQRVFENETPVDEMKKWIEDTRKDNKGTVAAPYTFEADVETYLSRCRALATYREKKFDLNLWLDALGRTRSRRTITKTEVEQVLQDWLLNPVTYPRRLPNGKIIPGHATSKTKHAQTIRKRKHNLQRLFTVLDGDGAANPVKGCATLQLRARKRFEAREIDYGVIARILAAMPTYRTRRRQQLNLTKIRCTVIAYTGIPPRLLQQVLPSDLSLRSEPPTVRLSERDKGEGVEARTLPLTPDGAEAFKVFHDANAYGEFDETGLNRSVKLWAQRIGYTRHVRLYDLRHSFGTMLYRSYGDKGAVEFMMMHAPGSNITARYTVGAHADVAAAAAQAFSSAVTNVRRNAMQAVAKPTPAAVRAAAAKKHKPAKATTHTTTNTPAKLRAV